MKQIKYITDVTVIKVFIEYLYTVLFLNIMSIIFEY